MVQLAIKGCRFRSDEIIEILKMLGGINTLGYEGNSEILYYYIDNDGNIECDAGEEIPFPCIYFTLDEFLEKFPYKVGDKVRMNGDDEFIYVVDTMYWKDECIVYTLRDIDGCIHANEWFTNELTPYKEQETMKGKK